MYEASVLSDKSYVESLGLTFLFSAQKSRVYFNRLLITLSRSHRSSIIVKYSTETNILELIIKQCL